MTNYPKFIDLEAARFNAERKRIVSIFSVEFDICVEIWIKAFSVDLDYAWALIFKGQMLRPATSRSSLERVETGINAKLPVLRRMLSKAQRDQITDLSFVIPQEVAADLEAARDKAAELMTAGAFYAAVANEEASRLTSPADSPLLAAMDQ